MNSSTTQTMVAAALNDSLSSNSSSLSTTPTNLEQLKREPTHKYLPKNIKSIQSLTEIFDDPNKDRPDNEPLEESTEEEYIRRINFTEKSSSVPYFVCSFIKPRKASIPFGAPPSAGTTPLPTMGIPNVASPIDQGEAPSLTSEELISKQTELEAITNSKKQTSYRNYILETVESDVYDPLFLDDPNIRTASKRKVMTLPGLMTSTIPFLKSKALKKDLNEQFKQQHENCLLTLSKIRKLKRKILKVVLRVKPDDFSIAALAYVYLEKMILKNQVHKANRKRIAAACLLLAFKMNLENSQSERKQVFTQLLDELESVFEVNRKRIVQTEFYVMSEGLHFNMLSNPKEIQPHLQRLLSEDQDRAQYNSLLL